MAQKEYTLEELQKMGGVPVDTNQQSYTLEQLQAMQQQNTTAITPSKTGFWKKAGSIATGALPAIGSTVGAIGGGLLGGLATSPTILGIPAGVYGGAVGGAALGASLGEAGKEAIQGKVISPSNVAKFGLEYGALEAIAGPVAGLAGKAIKATGAGVAKMFIPKSEVESAMLQTYKASTSFIDRFKSILGLGGKEAPTTAASSAFEKNLVGTEKMLGVGAEKAQRKLWKNLLQPALKQSKTEIEIPDFLKQSEDKIISETKDPTRQKVLLNALNAVKEDFSGIKKITLEQLQKYKEGWAEFVPEKAYKGQPIAGALNDVRNTLAGMARNKIYTELGDNVKQAYLDYSNLFGIKQLGIKAGTGITSVIKGGTGTSIKNILEMATIPVGTIGGQVIYRTGQGVEFLGKPGVRILRNLLFDAGTSSGNASPANQSQDMSQSLPNQ